MKLCFRGLVLLIINIHTNKTDEMIFIDKALPDKTTEIKDNKHFFLELFKNQKNKNLLKIKNELKDEKKSTFSFLTFELQDLMKESKTQNDFFWQLVHIKTLLKIKNFAKLDASEKLNKIISIKNKIEKKDKNKDYKEVLKHFEIKDEINDNVGYSKYIHKKLGEQYKPIYDQLLVQKKSTKKDSNKFIKTSSVIIMISAAAILIYFFILIETITISGNKKTIQNIKIISSNGEDIIKGIAEPKNKKETNQIKESKNTDQKISNKILENALEEENDEIEDESIVTPESSCFE